ncbi:MAG: hypothetical protein ABIK77_04150 [candidate division WOR-3 bacterium]
MIKKITFPFYIILTDEDIYFPEDKIWLSEEQGYWERNRIYIYARNSSSVIKWSIFIHELIEMILEKKFKIPHKFSHQIANIFESIFTLGKNREYF